MAGFNWDQLKVGANKLWLLKAELVIEFGRGAALACLIGTDGGDFICVM